VLILHAKVLILDKPAAVLTPQETDELLAIMRNLANAGTAVVFIAHKPREVEDVADQVVALRRWSGEALSCALKGDRLTQRK
jgi:ABC-type uncharacterized transport system ATPase subunit